MTPDYIGIALACVTLACFQLGLTFASTAFVYLIVILLLSLLDSFNSSAIFSSIAIGCLNYFFVEPRFSFQVNFAEDLTTLIAFLLTAFVVTGFVRRARQSAEVERERARLLDLTQDAILVRDANDVITYWNRGAERLYGWSRHEAVGRIKHDLLRPDFPGSFDEAKAALLRTGRWEGELVHTRRDGQRVTVESRWSLQVDDSKNQIGTLKTHHDITERRRAQELLHQSQAAYLAEAQRLSLTGSFGWSVPTGEVFWSEETFRIFGYASSIKPSLQAVMERVHPDDVTPVRQVIERAEAQAFDFEHRLQLPDGAIKHLRVVVSYNDLLAESGKLRPLVADVANSVACMATCARSRRPPERRVCRCSSSRTAAQSPTISRAGITRPRINVRTLKAA